ncbi:MAG: hypothetical protein KAU44_06535, partial [Candidatus Marinimicrobia bacterium]|nr:hypothetical protein [Candidatus Neomarinimicrobiota bacterium]
KIIISLVCITIISSLYAVPAPFMNPPNNDKYSPSAQALGMGGSFANIWADDPQGMWENPAATAMFAHKNRIGISTSNLEWLNPMGSGAIIGGLKFGEKFTLGLGMSTVNWTYNPEMYSPELFYGALSAAVSWNSFIQVSIGLNQKILYMTYPDTTMTRDKSMDIGAIVEWPILASMNKGDINMFDRKMHFDITPGIHYTFKNLGPEVRNNYLFGFNINVSLTDIDAGSEMIHIKYAHDMKDSESMNALQIGLYDIMFIRFGNHTYGSTVFNASGYGINYSRLIMNVVHAFGADMDRSSIVNQVDIEHHWGNWTWDGADVGVSGNTFMLKWRF